MVQLQVTINGSKVEINIMSREDATPDEYELAKTMGNLHFEVFKQSEQEVKVTKIKDLRPLAMCPTSPDHNHHFEPGESLIVCMYCGISR